MEMTDNDAHASLIQMIYRFREKIIQYSNRFPFSMEDQICGYLRCRIFFALAAIKLTS